MNRKMSETFSIMLVVSFGSIFGSGRPFKSDHFTSYTSLVWRIETDDFHHGPVMKLIIIFEVFTKNTIILQLLWPLRIYFVEVIIAN